MPQKAPEGCADGQRGPETDAEIGVEQGIGIGADGEKGDIAQIEQTDQADGDVEAQAEHHVDQGLRS